MIVRVSLQRSKMQLKMHLLIFIAEMFLSYHSFYIRLKEREANESQIWSVAPFKTNDARFEWKQNETQTYRDKRQLCERKNISNEWWSGRGLACRTFAHFMKHKLRLYFLISLSNKMKLSNWNAWNCAMAMNELHRLKLIIPNMKHEMLTAQISEVQISNINLWIAWITMPR